MDKILYSHIKNLNLTLFQLKALENACNHNDYTQLKTFLANRGITLTASHESMLDEWGVLIVRRLQNEWLKARAESFIVSSFIPTLVGHYQDAKTMMLSQGLSEYDVTEIFKRTLERMLKKVNDDLAPLTAAKRLEESIKSNVRKDLIATKKARIAKKKARIALEQAGD